MDNLFKKKPHRHYTVYVDGTIGVVTGKECYAIFE